MSGAMVGKQPRPVQFVVDERNCFLVTSHKPNHDGYCRVRIDGRKQMLHRLIYEECFGLIPDGLSVLHRCDVPRCINPEHLFLGTQLDNMRDMSKKGRSPRGERSGKAKLTLIEVREILTNTTSLHRELAVKYGVSEITIGQIKNRNRWRHVSVQGAAI